MKYKKILSSLLLLAINSHCAFADIPYISNSTITSVGYNKSTAMILVDGASDITLVPGSIPGSYTNCQSGRTYYMGLVASGVFSYGYGYGQVWTGNTRIRVECGDKYSDMMDKWKKTFGSSIRGTIVQQSIGGSYLYPDERFPENGYRICLGINDLTYMGSWVSDYLPGVSCQTSPAPPSVCTSLPDMLFDHGTISQGSNLQNTKIVNATLNCTATTSVTLSLSSPIKLDNGIINHFYVNNKILDSTPVTVNITNSNTPLQFSSVIESAANGGSFSGSSVLILTVN